ncbi:hypothetical protein B0H16DRAFT_1684254, partial [Mycena metata]
APSSRPRQRNTNAVAPKDEAARSSRYAVYVPETARNASIPPSSPTYAPTPRPRQRNTNAVAPKDEAACSSRYLCRVCNLRAALARTLHRPVARRGNSPVSNAKLGVHTGGSGVDGARRRHTATRKHTAGNPPARRACHPTSTFSATESAPEASTITPGRTAHIHSRSPPKRRTKTLEGREGANVPNVHGDRFAWPSPSVIERRSAVARS